MPTISVEPFKVGSFVFTTKEIRIWGDYLLQKPIPINSRGKVISVTPNAEDIALTVYEVTFDKHLPIFKIKHSNLR